MDHEFTETQTLLQSAAKDFFTREYPLERMREIHMKEPGYDLDLWARICDMGWTAAPFPESVAGYEGSLLDGAVIIQELGRAAAISPYTFSAVASGLAMAGEREELVQRIASGEAVVTTTSPTPGPPGDRLAVKPSLTAGEVTLTGTIHAMPWAKEATHMLIPVDDAYALLEADQPAVRTHTLESTGAEPRYRVELENARAEMVRPSADTTQPSLLGAAAHSILMVGHSSRALELAVAYAKERVQFGQAIGSFQAIQHKCADMQVAVETGRHLSFKAAWAHGNDPDHFGCSARYAKAFMGDAAAFVTRQAIQVHGGVGFIDSHQVQLFYLGATTAASTFGTSHELREELSRQLLTQE